MIAAVTLGARVAHLSLLIKQAVKVQRGRSGRTHKGPAMAKQLAAAGSARQDHKGIFAYPRGHAV